LQIELRFALILCSVICSISLQRFGIVLEDPSMLSDLFSSGHIVDAILGLVLLETAGLLTYARITGRGIAPLALLPNLVAGSCLLLALRGVLVDAPWYWTAASLTAALIAHLADLGQRWRH
jgi:hypothetical protein